MSPVHIMYNVYFCALVTLDNKKCDILFGTTEIRSYEYNCTSVPQNPSYFILFEFQTTNYVNAKMYENTNILLKFMQYVTVVCPVNYCNNILL